MQERSHTGRRRNEEVRHAILRAALELVAAGPFTMQELARRAEVSKRTLYRWWSSGFEVVAEALAARAASDVLVEDTGDLHADLRVFTRSLYEAASGPISAPALRFLMANAQDGGPAAAALRTFIDRRRAPLLDLLSTALARGDLPKGSDVALLADVVFGVLWYRLLVGHLDVDVAAADAVASLVSGPRPTASGGSRTGGARR